LLESIAIVIQKIERKINIKTQELICAYISA